MRLVIGPDEILGLASQPVSSKVLQLLAHLVSIADENGVCTHSREEIAQAIGMHREIVSKNITRLVNAGIITRQDWNPAGLRLEFKEGVAGV